MQYIFRGLTADNKWVFGSLIQRVDGIGKLSLIEVQDKEGEIMVWQVKDDSAGMWTGLTDKNGVKIYDGDILKAFTPSVPSYEVFYCKSSYRLRYKLKSNDFYDWGPLFRMDEIFSEGRLKMYPEVIGNIHDNPELLTPAK